MTNNLKSFDIHCERNTIFPIVVGMGSWHACNKVHGFIHYNVKYIMFIVAYMTLILEFHTWLLK